MKEIIIGFVLIIISLGGYSQVQDVPKNNTHYLGFNAGSISGIGLTYRFQPNKYGFQLTFLPIKAADYTWVSAGLMVSRKFKEGKYIDLNFYGGVHYLYNKYIQTNYFASNTPPYNGYFQEETIIEEHFNFGGGLGFEFKISNNFRINTHVGYGFYNQEFLNIYPAGELSMLYGF